MSALAFSGLAFAGFLCFLGCLLLLHKYSSRQGFRFIKSVVNRFAELSLVIAAMSFIIWLIVLSLDYFYWTGATLGELISLESIRVNIQSWLETWIPGPVVLAIIAGTLILLLALVENNGDEEKEQATTLAKFGLWAMGWTGRATTLCALIASFTFLTGSEEFEAYRISLELGEAQEHAARLDESIQQIAFEAAIDDFESDVKGEYSDEELRALARAIQSLESLESHTRVYRSEIPSKLRRPATNFLDANYRVEKPARTSPKQATNIEKYHRLTAETLKNLSTEIRSARWQGKSPLDLPSQVRNAFVNNVTTVLRDRALTIRGSVTGNVIADLFIDSLHESSVEHIRNSWNHRAERLRDVVGSSERGIESRQLEERFQSTEKLSHNARLTSSPLDTNRLNSLADQAKTLETAAKPDEKKLSKRPANALKGFEIPNLSLKQQIQKRFKLPFETDLDGIDSEDSSCPPGQVRLRCSRGGASFCGSPLMNGSPC